MAATTSTSATAATTYSSELNEVDTSSPSPYSKILDLFPDLEYENVLLEQQSGSDTCGYVLLVQRKDFYVSTVDSKGFILPFSPVRVVVQEDGRASLQVLFQRIACSNTLDGLYDLLYRISRIGGHYLCAGTNCMNGGGGGISPTSSSSSGHQFEQPIKAFGERAADCELWFKPTNEMCIFDKIYGQCQACRKSVAIPKLRTALIVQEKANNKYNNNNN